MCIRDRKNDVPPPSANPARASKNRPAKPTGNEGAIRDKSAGRGNNRSRDVSSSAAARKTNTRRATDRHSRSGKVDTEKKVNQGWGDDNKELSAEEAAEADAEAEIAADAEEKEKASKQMSLQDYLSTVNTDLNKVPEVTKNINALEGAELFVKEEEEYAPATKVKNVKSKQLKTKNFLDFSATFSDALPKERKNFGGRGGRGDSRRGGRGGKNLSLIHI